MVLAFEFHPAYLTLPLLAVVLTRRWWRRREERRAPALALPGPEEHGRAFGYKRSWLALRADDPAAVAEALGLEHVHSVTWSGGLHETYAGDRAVFVTPPVDGWVLAVGAFGEGHDREEDLASLSRRFGEAQLFSTHRVVEYHEWQRWVAGHPQRRYAYVGESGEVLFDEGEPGDADASVPTAEELDDDELDWDRIADEETVMEVAAEWSVNPTTLDERTDLAPTGLLGYRPRLNSS